MSSIGSRKQIMFRFDDLTWKEARDVLTDRDILILPVGSTEAHGPHLPLATDVIISEEMARRAAEKLIIKGIPALVLPPLAYSVTDFSADFPGTISIRKATATALILDICASLYRQGARLVAIANSHLEPEHVASIEDAIAQVKQETGRVVAFPDKRRRRWAATLTEEFRRGDCHAGSYETSLVMAARPDLVREEIRSGLEPVPISIAERIREGAATFTEAGGDQAYFGDPRGATKEEGDSSYEALSEMLVIAITEALEAEESGGSEPQMNTDQHG
jgi:creatinine amidohydrolase